LGESKMFIFMLYLTVMFVTTFVSNFGISKQFKASWIFYTAPIENKGQFIMGALKYIYAKYILPMQAIIFIICMLVWGWPVFMDLVISNIVVITIGMMMYYHGLRAYPFSIEAKDNNQVGSVFKILLTMFLMLPIGIVQAFLQGIWWGQVVFLMLVIFWFLYYYDSIANQMKDKKIIMSKSL
jgi:ABC-2 type transport system permease protein